MKKFPKLPLKSRHSHLNTSKSDVSQSAKFLNVPSKVKIKCSSRLETMSHSHACESEKLLNFLCEVKVKRHLETTSRSVSDSGKDLKVPGEDKVKDTDGMRISHSISEETKSLKANATMSSQ